MKKKRVIQPVSFNMEDVYEEELWKYAIEQQKYFSKYVKRLIETDRLRKEMGEGVIPKRRDEVVKRERSKGDVTAVNSFL